MLKHKILNVQVDFACAKSLTLATSPLEAVQNFLENDTLKLFVRSNKNVRVEV
jgi:hypothetical protein